MLTAICPTARPADWKSANSLFAKAARIDKRRDDVEHVIVAEDAEDGREGYLYDFGQNNAGIVRLRIHGRAGQRIVLQFGELLTEGELDYNNILFYPDGFSQTFLCV